MRETPRIANGKVAVVVHLLAPNQRPVQTTSDLSGFWERLYPQVRRELSRRYPKHKWPETSILNSMRRVIAALFLFGISFGYVEAAVVVYLRAIYDPVRQRIHPERKPGDLFPLITPQQLADAGPENPRRLLIEIGREAATMVMLGLGRARGGAQLSSVVRGVRHRVRRLGHHVLCVLEADDSLAGVAQHLGHSVSDSAAVGRSGLGAGAGGIVDDRVRIDCAPFREYPWDCAALGSHVGRSGRHRNRVRLGLPEHQRGRPSESFQLAAIPARRSDRAHGVFRCSKDSRISGISKTARLTIAAALALKRAKLDGSNNSRRPASISRKDFRTTPTCFSRTHSVL